MAARNHVRLDGHDTPVSVTPGSNDTVEVRLGEGAQVVTLVGSRFDVHRLIIEADRQLGRLSNRFVHL